MVTSEAGRKIVKDAEGLKLKAYKCPAGVWTIGYGHTGNVKPDAKITEHQADAILSVDLDHAEKCVDKLCPDVNQNEFDALVSLAFNIGTGSFARSQVLWFVKSGAKDKAADAFLQWTHGGGKELPGLVKRRNAERQLFLTPVEQSA
jgi:lysozyme